MIDQYVVEYVRTIHSEQRSGVLRIRRNELLRRLYFEDGHFVILDYGQSKDHALVQALVEWNKVNGQMCRYALEQHEESGRSVSDILVSQQLVTQEEIAEVMRGMVEDVLCDCFAGEHELVEWVDEAPDAEIAPFDLEFSAVRLRIDVDTLLSMVQSRIQEREHALSVIGDYDQIYRCNEEAPNGETLNEMERIVLCNVDGRSSVGDVAKLLRQSQANIACFFASLHEQGFISKGAVGASRLLAAVQAPVGEQVSAEAKAETSAQDDNDVATLDDFEVYHEREEIATRSWPAVLIGAAVLCTAVLVVVLAFSSGQESSQQENEVADLHEATVRGDWREANAMYLDLRAAARGNLLAERQLKKQVRPIRNSVDSAMERLATAIAEEEARAMADALAEVPEALAACEALLGSERLARLAELRAEARRTEAELRERALALTNRARALLAKDQAAAAASMIRSQDQDLLVEAARRQLNAWRSEALRRVQQPATGFLTREALIQQLQHSDPTDEEAERIASERSRLREERAEAATALRERVPAAIARGDFAAAEERLAALRQRIGEDPLGETVHVLAEQAAALREHIEGRLGELRAALINGSEVATYRRLAEQLRTLAGRYAEAPAHADLRSGALLADVCVTVRQQAETLSDEATLLRAALGELSGSFGLDRAVEQRLAFLVAENKRAADLLARGESLAQEHRYDDAIAVLERIHSDEALRRSDAGAEAERRLRVLRTTRQERQRSIETMVAAMRADDGVTVQRIADRWDLRDLPVMIFSDPSGATVRAADGSVLGTTPVLLREISDAERLRETVRCELPGYEACDMALADAAGAWRLYCKLERATHLSVQIDEPLTGAPAVIDGTLHVSGTRHCWQLDAAGMVTALTLPSQEAQSRQFPILAPPVTMNAQLFLITRDQQLLRLGNDAAAWSTPLRSRMQPQPYRSRILLDRSALIVVDDAGVVAAISSEDGSVFWRFAASAPLVTPPVLDGETLHCWSADGYHRQLSAENGALLSEERLGERLLNATRIDAGWRVVLPEAVHVLSDDAAPSVEELTPAAAQAAPGIIRNRERRLLVLQSDGSWQQLGHVDSDTVDHLRAWHGHAVAAQGERLRVIGARHFERHYNAAISALGEWDGRLVVIVSDGRIEVFDP